MDIDPHNLGPVVYKLDQVITREDLKSIMEGFAYQYGTAHWWEKDKKSELLHAIEVVRALENWLNDGKKMEAL